MPETPSIKPLTLGCDWHIFERWVLPETLSPCEIYQARRAVKSGGGRDGQEVVRLFCFRGPVRRAASSGRLGAGGASERGPDGGRNRLRGRRRAQVLYPSHESDFFRRNLPRRRNHGRAP